MTATEITILVALAVALLLTSGFFSGSEVALFGLRRVDREQLGHSGRPIDGLILTLVGQPKRLVGSVLIGKELVNMTLAAIAAYLWMPAWPEAAPWVVGGLAVLATAASVILLGEVVPKTLAIQNPIAWARQAARPLAAFSLLIAPLRWVIHGVSDLVARPFGGANRPRAADLSEEEFRKLVDAGSAQGQVDARERRLIHKVFEFGDRSVGQVMTPRDKVFALAYDLPMARLVKEVAARGFSRVPIYQRSLDNIRGILNAKDLVRATAGQSPARTLSELLSEPLYVPRTTPVARLFTIMKQKKVHLALVVSEYGKLLGLVTMDDLLALLFGDINDERDTLQRAVRRGRGGRTPVPGSLPAVDGTAVDGAAVDGTAPVPRLTETALVEAAAEAQATLAAAAAAAAEAEAVPEPTELTPPPPPPDEVPT
ncbi:MAG: HlyC/CorC family transporter [Myxococcales bacterium]|nr:HlyC/CorC family transporter [Myxococcales bacterium]